MSASLVHSAAVMVRVSRWRATAAAQTREIELAAVPGEEQ
jgi:hypothetical protein